MKFRPKFFWKWSFFDQTQQPLKSVEPFERILRALFMAQCPYKFSSFLDLRNASDRFRLFPRDFRLFRFFFPGSACFSTMGSPQNLPGWIKYDGKIESFWKEFRWTKLIHSGGEGDVQNEDWKNRIVVPRYRFRGGSINQHGSWCGREKQPCERAFPLWDKLDSKIH